MRKALNIIFFTITFALIGSGIMSVLLAPWFPEIALPMIFAAIIAFLILIILGTYIAVTYGDVEWL